MKLWNALLRIALGLIGLTSLVLCIPQLLGMTPMAVLSGSMEPSYPVGSLVFIKDVSPDNIKEGTVITFHLGEENLLVTHRVVEADKKSGTYVTKGDANHANDEEVVSSANVVGAPLFTIPYVGYIAMFLDTVHGKVIAILSVLVITMLMIVTDVFLVEKKETVTDGV
ncbi:signal peptidase I [Lachnospiraceae bacterium LCP25S3_G4]